MTVSPLIIVVYGVVNFIVALLSGISGGGGGFINTPLLIFIGLSPAQAVATGKFSGLAIAGGSLQGLRKVKGGSKKLIASVMILALVIGLGAPQIISRLDNDLYRTVLGIILLAMVPILVLKRVGLHVQSSSRVRQVVGFALLIGALGLQAVFSSGLGTLVNIVLMAFMGLSALEANVTKRYSQLILNSVIIIGVVVAHLVVWPIALLTLLTAGAGGFIGGKLAVRRGNTFVMAIFVVMMIASGLELIFG